MTDTLYDPIPAAERSYCDRADAEDDALEAAQIRAEDDYLELCQQGNANAVASFAPKVTDWESDLMKEQTLAEVLFDSLDITDGPEMAELMQVLLDAVRGSKDLQAKASALLQRMNRAWVDTNVDQPRMEAA